MKKIKNYCTRHYSTDNTYKCLIFILALGRCFAMFPVRGLIKSDIRYLRFRWISWFTLYTFSYLAGIMTTIGFYLYHYIATKEFNFGDFVSLFFFSCAFLATASFLKLCQSWPKLMRTWTEVDYRLRRLDSPNNLSIRLKIISAIILFAALLEHILYLSSAISKVENFEGWQKFENFLHNNFQHVFDYTPFAIWKGILFLMLNFMCTFTWNYTDLFIMLVSTSLARKFKLINYQLRSGLLSKSKEVSFWNKLRDNYNAVSVLCKAVDNSLSGIVLLSFGNNLFIILVQLYNSLKPRFDSTIGRIYFMYSFLFLIFRTIAVLLYASSIHETNTEAAILLMSTPADVYNAVIERLLRKVQVDPPVLTGKNFFSVTRPLILNIASAIVTYELVLIQFQVVT